ncbi:hypothetical protein ACL90Y_08025 [Micrococcus luteus]
MKKNLAWLAVPALMLSLSACDSEPGSVTSRGDAPASSSSPAASPSEEAASAEEATDASAEPEQTQAEESTSEESAASESGADEGAEQSSESTEASGESAETSAESTEADAADEAPANPSQPTFGDTYTWNDGVAVAVGQPQRFTPSASAFVEDEALRAQAYSFDVTVENGSGEPIDSMETSLQASSGGEQSGMVYDSAAGLDTPTVSIQPGKSLNFKVVFTLKDPADINMDVAPTWMHDSVNFATR